MRRTFTVSLLLILGSATLLAPRATQAQDDRRCFPTVPGVTACIEGRFRAYVTNGASSL